MYTLSSGSNSTIDFYRSNLAESEDFIQPFRSSSLFSISEDFILPLDILSLFLFPSRLNIMAFYSHICTALSIYRIFFCDLENTSGGSSLRVNAPSKYYLRHNTGGITDHTSRAKYLFLLVPYFQFIFHRF